MKRCFVLRKYILSRWGKKILNKVFGCNLPFCRTYVLGAVQAFSVLLQACWTSVLSRVFISVSWFCGFLVGGFGQEILVRFMSVGQQVLFRFLIFITVELCFIRLFFKRLHRILIIFKYVFIYLCISILSVFSYVKGSVLFTRVRQFRWRLCVRTFVRFSLLSICRYVFRVQKDCFSFYCSNFLDFMLTFQVGYLL